VCDRIAILYGGKIRAEGAVRDLLRHSDKTEITTAGLSRTAIEKIKHVLADEHAEYTIDSPMDKLETFFINIVAAAQRQAVPTSGAESKTQISEFLTGKTDDRARRAAMLDSLVTAKPADETASPQTQNVQPQAFPASMPDEDLLRQLTKQGDSSDLKPAAAKPAQPSPLQSSPANQDILDELSGRVKPDKKQDPSAAGPGDSANA
jgi:hypothetical protein